MNFEDTIRALARVLSREATYKGNRGHSGVITLPAEMVHCQRLFGTKSGRARLSVFLPSDNAASAAFSKLPTKVAYKDVTVALRRGPQSIAADIERRLMPVVRRTWTAYLAERAGRAKV